jgi:hypothetical protein
LQVLDSMFFCTNNGVGVYIVGFGTTNFLYVARSNFTNCLQSIVTQAIIDNITVSNSTFVGVLGSYGVSGGILSTVSNINVTGSNFTDLFAGVFYGKVLFIDKFVLLFFKSILENPGQSVYIDGNWFYNVDYAGTTFNNSSSAIFSNNYINGRSNSTAYNAAFETYFGTAYVEIRNNQVYNHCLSITGTKSALVQDNYINGCDCTGISVFALTEAEQFQISNNKVRSPISPSLSLITLFYLNSSKEAQAGYPIANSSWVKFQQEFSFTTLS